MLTGRSGEYKEGSDCPEGVCIIEDVSHSLWQELSPLLTACGHFSSAHLSPSSDALTLMKEIPRICIQITFSGEPGFHQMTHPSLL